MLRDIQFNSIFLGAVSGVVGGIFVALALYLCLNYKNRDILINLIINATCLGSISTVANWGLTAVNPAKTIYFKASTDSFQDTFMVFFPVFLIWQFGLGAYIIFHIKSLKEFVSGIDTDIKQDADNRVHTVDIGLNSTPEHQILIEQAREAVAAGRDVKAVRKMLSEMGVDPRNL